MEMFIAQPVDRGAETWTPFTLSSEGVYTGTTASNLGIFMKMRKACTLRPGAPDSVSLSKRCHRRDVKGAQKIHIPSSIGRKSRKNSSSIRENGRVLGPTGSCGSVPPSHPHCPLCRFSLSSRQRGRLRQSLRLAFYWVTPELRAGERNVLYIDPWWRESLVYIKKKTKQYTPLTLSPSGHFLFVFLVDLSAPCYAIYRRSSRVWDLLYFQTL